MPTVALHFSYCSRAEKITEVDIDVSARKALRKNWSAGWRTVVVIIRIFLGDQLFCLS